jgi:hypothetical protein
VLFPLTPTSLSHGAAIELDRSFLKIVAADVTTSKVRAS